MITPIKIELILHYTEFFCIPYHTHNDFENIISKFNGTTHAHVTTWFDRFENIASSFPISKQQKFIFVQNVPDCLDKIHL